jgi:hypothetical protein
VQHFILSAVLHYAFSALLRRPFGAALHYSFSAALHYSFSAALHYSFSVALHYVFSEALHYASRSITSLQILNLSEVQLNLGASYLASLHLREHQQNISNYFFSIEADSPSLFNSWVHQFILLLFV